MNQYNGASADLRTISIPDDIDVADSESVNIAFRSLKDSSFLALSVKSEEPIHHRVAMSCADTSSIISQPIGGYMQQTQTFVPYSYIRGFRVADAWNVLDLDTPAPTQFEAETVYYCYNVWDPASRTFRRRITKGFPEETLALQKTDNFSHYIGSFFTDSGKRIVRFQKSAGYYTVEDPYELLNPIDLNPVTFNLAKVIPAHCNRVRLRVETYNTTGTVDFCKISAGGFEQPLAMSVHSQATQYADVILRSKTLSARLASTTANEAVITIEGYWES